MTIYPKKRGAPPADKDLSIEDVRKLTAKKNNPHVYEGMPVWTPNHIPLETVDGLTKHWEIPEEYKLAVFEEKRKIEQWLSLKRPLADTDVKYYTGKNILKIGGVEIPIRGMLASALCQGAFNQSTPFGDWVTEDYVAHISATEGEWGLRTFYDTVRHVNALIENVIGTQILQYNAHRVRIRSELLE